ncbi:MAG: porin [Solimonas sp.]
MDLNDGAIVGGKMQDLTLGVSWYLNNDLRISASYVGVLKMDRPGSACDSQKPAAFQMPFQPAI